MRIGIDISQIVYEGTGVGRYVRELITHVVARGTDTEFVLFGASLRKRKQFTDFLASLPRGENVSLKVIPVPPTLLDLFWNVFHIIPVEWLIGPVDIFWSSDWTQPPLVHARGMTTIHDLIALKFPGESHAVTEFHPGKLSVSANIVATHKRRLARVVEECEIILCDSLATKNDCKELLGISESKLHVVYPGFTL